MSAPPVKTPSSPLDPYWTREQLTGQMDAFSGATQNPYVARKQLHRDGSLQSQCDTLIDGGYRGTLSFKDDQRERVMQFARREANGEIRYRGLRCVFRNL